MYDKIRKLARERGITIPNLEKACGLSNGSISKWNNSSPRVDSIAKVASYFDVPIERFLDGEAGANCSEFPNGSDERPLDGGAGQRGEAVV